MTFVTFDLWRGFVTFCEGDVIDAWRLTNDGIADRLMRYLDCAEMSPERGGFERTAPTWRCPGCARAKWQIAKRDRNGRLLIGIVQHHCHLGDMFWDMCKAAEIAPPSPFAPFERFAREDICQDCNALCPFLRQAAGVTAEKYFSLSPFEMRLLLRWPGTPKVCNGAHQPRQDAAIAIWQAAKPMYEIAKLRIHEWVEAQAADKASGL